MSRARLELLISLTRRTVQTSPDIPKYDWMEKQISMSVPTAYHSRYLCLGYLISTLGIDIEQRVEVGFL